MPMPPKEETTLSWITLLRLSAVVITVLALFYFRDLIALFLAAAVIAAAVEAPASFLMRKRWPRFAAVTAVYVGGLVILGIILYAFVPVLVGQAQEVIKAMLIFLSKLNLPVLIPDLQKFLEDFSNNFSTTLPSIGKSAGQAVAFVSELIGGIFSAVLVFVVSFYLSLQEKWVERTLRILAPRRYETYLIDLWERSERKIGKWFYTQIILSFVVGVPMFIGLSMMGVNFSVILGIIAGMLEIVPVAGPIISGIFAFIIAVQQDFNLGLYTIVLALIIQQLENHVFVPTLMKKSLGLNPVVIIFSLLVGARLAGFWGILIAVPIAAAASEFFADLEKLKLRGLSVA